MKNEWHSTGPGDEKSDSLLTPEQVAQVLQVHLLTVYGYIRQGKLPAIRLGRAYRVVPGDLRGFITSNRTGLV